MGWRRVCLIQIMEKAHGLVDLSESPVAVGKSATPHEKAVFYNNCVETLRPQDGDVTGRISGTFVGGISLPDKRVTSKVTRPGPGDF